MSSCAPSITNWMRGFSAGTKSRTVRRRILAHAVADFGVELLERRVLLSAFTPSQMRQAYGVDSISFGGTAGDGSGQTIGIVVAYHNPDLVTSVDEFNNDPTNGFGLQRFQNGTTVTTGPTLTVLDQNGLTSYPSEGTEAWDDEEALDVEWAHAIAPQANIVVVEANSFNSSNDFADMYTAEGTAAAYNGAGGDVSVVINCWDTTESSTESTHDSKFATPSGKAGVAFLVAAGDVGAIGQYPSMSPGVISVGASSLSTSSGAWSSEAVWSNSLGAGGGGVSQYESQPSDQTGNDNGTGTIGGTSYRATPDVTMDGDPLTGAYIVDDARHTGRYQIGGTSLATPMWGGLIAIADQGRQILNSGTPNPLDTATAVADLYSASPSDFHDVVNGSNGYAATSGYDLASGRGSPVANLLVPALAGYSVGTQLAFASPPSTSITAGTSGLPSLTVDVNDSSGSLITTDNSAVTLSVYDGQGSGITLNDGSLTVDAVNGVATFNNPWLTAPPTRAGTYQLAATDGSDVAATFSFTVTAATAHTAVTPTVIASFDNTSAPLGNTPMGGLVMDGSGNMYGTTEFGGANGVGTIFEIDASTHTLMTLASFGVGSSDGNEPDCTLAVDGSGNLFGTTLSQGLGTGYGTFFELAHGSGTINTLVDFNSSTTGEYPDGAVVIDSSGNIYGTASAGTGSSNGGGTIFEYNLGTSTLSPLISFAGNATNGADPHGGLVIDSSGNLYGTTTSYSTGGSSFYGTVFEVSGGTLQTLGVFTGPNGQNPQGTLILDANGNLYGTTEAGGVSGGVGTVFEVVKGTDTITTLASFDTLGSDPYDAYGGLLIDGNGNLYGTTYTDAGIGDGAIYEIAAGTFTISTLASFTGTNGSQSYSALVLDANGNLFGTASSGGAHGDGSVFELPSIANPAWLAAGSDATWDNSTSTLTLTGKAWIDANPFDFGDTPDISASVSTAELRIQPVNSDTQVQLGTLSLSSGAIAWIATTTTPDTFMLEVNGLSLGSGSTLDMGNNWMSINYTSSPVATIQGYLQNGCDGGLWDGLGTSATGGAIWSSSAQNGAANTYGLGYADSADGVVSGQASNTIEVKFTLLGDANLDGTVSQPDANILQAHWLATGSPSWDDGNFNYDSTININDALPLTRNWGDSV